jgi:hypothetical protein
MAIDQARTARGAAAGALAAAVWAVQMPLDKRVFEFGYDDVELLGKAVTRGRGWRLAGLVLHIQNGALFGAIYSNAAPRVPLPSWSRGPLAALSEHLATWPLTAVVEHFHPARKELPQASRSARAFAQATWRHLLFGVVLGELERRLNPETQDVPPEWTQVMSTNGHGNIEHAATAGGLR